MALPVGAVMGLHAQSISGRVYSSTGQPVVDALVSSTGAQTVRTDADGAFTIEGVKKGNALQVMHDGFYQRSIYLNHQDATNLRIYMVEENKIRFCHSVCDEHRRPGCS